MKCCFRYLLTFVNNPPSLLAKSIVDYSGELANAEFLASTNCKCKTRKFRKDHQVFTINTIRNLSKIMFPKRLLSRIERAMICRNQLYNNKEMSEIYGHKSRIFGIICEKEPGIT